MAFWRSLQGTGIVTDEILPPLKHQGVEGRVRYLVLHLPIHDTNHKDGNVGYKLIMKKRKKKTIFLLLSKIIGTHRI
jgi:hypothetical protein